MRKLIVSTFLTLDGAWSNPHWTDQSTHSSNLGAAATSGGGWRSSSRRRVRNAQPSS